MRLLDLLFSNKEVHNVDGREIIIRCKKTTRTELGNVMGHEDKELLRENREQVKKALMNLCNTNNIVKSFPRIEFIIGATRMGEDPLFPRAKGWVNSREIAKNEIRVYIHDDFSAGREGYTRQLIELIVHELTHVRHLRDEKTIAQLKRFRTNLLGKVVANFFARADIRKLGKASETGVIRLVIGEFIRNLQIEGVATYSGNVASGKTIINQKTFMHTYNDASKIAEEVIEKWNEFCRNEFSLYDEKEKNEIEKWGTARDKMERDCFRLGDDLQHRQYPLGEHIVYATLYIDHNLELDDLMKMSIFEFIKKYEACMKKVKKTPVVSVTSGKGIIDYKRMLNQWSEIAKN